MPTWVREVSPAGEDVHHVVLGGTLGHELRGGLAVRWSLSDQPGDRQVIDG
jgi:hypothetical protein